MTIQDDLHQSQLQVEQTLINILSTQTAGDKQLLSAARYSLFNGGKRLRPHLVFLTGQMLGADMQALQKVAAAIECIHSYSLVHDDLPAMDDDDLRRGKPTCHIAFDEATAILAGDALQTLAFDILSERPLPQVEAATQLKIISELAKASGLVGMCGGQALDLSATGKSITVQELEQIHKLKTGALLVSAITMGALCAKGTSQATLQHLAEFGHKIGLAFQVHDDILDIEGDTITLGKPQGSDVEANKSTYPAFMGLQGAKNLTQSLYQEALVSLSKIPADTTKLEELAHYIISRDH